MESKAKLTKYFNLLLFARSSGNRDNTQEKRSVNNPTNLFTNEKRKYYSDKSVKLLLSVKEITSHRDWEQAMLHL